ncbi:MAG: hypothetical protein J2P24_14340 [Streptosporangiales bacterium]|nr:hypothetical protein [Streptosporangiales bacterium]
MDDGGRAPGTAPARAVELVRSLIDRYSFGEVAAVTELLDWLDDGVRAEVGRLCAFGSRLLELDAEDFDHAPGVPRELAARAAASWIPQRPDATNRGALESLLPAYRLMLEVVAVRWTRGDMSRALSGLHILNEYLPLLVWQPVLGHAADPARIGGYVNRPGSLWASYERACEHAPVERRAGRIAVAVAGRPVAEWLSYLDRHHSHVADALAVCAGFCAADCAVRTQLPTQVREDLRVRMRVARRLGGSPLVVLRHAAPVGHGFGVPDAGEVADAWEQTRDRLDDPSLPAAEARVARRVRADDGFPLAGLPSFLSAVSGLDVRPDTLVRDVRVRVASLVTPR